MTKIRNAGIKIIFCVQTTKPRPTREKETITPTLFDVVCDKKGKTEEKSTKIEKDEMVRKQIQSYFVFNPFHDATYPNSNPFR